jgi:acetyl-CoA carboxylase biotin carboxyl carrier protein
MWQDKLKEIIYILENSNVNEIEVSFWGRKFRVVKEPNILPQDDSGPDVQAVDAPTGPKETLREGESVLTEQSPKGEELLSPMPGTYYAAATPDDPPFISKGDSVREGQTLCIIEAMKIMNEIESEWDGIVTEIMVENGDPVEYNQPLFLIDPA